MGFSQAIAICIIIATAATLHSSGITNIESSAQAVEALRPVAGDFAFSLFAIGIVGTGMLAVPILAGSAAYAVSEMFGWTEGLDRKPREAKAFYITIGLATLGGMALNFAMIDPVKALFWAAVVNGVRGSTDDCDDAHCNQQASYGRLTFPISLRIGGRLATAVMMLVTIGLFVV